MKLNFFYLFFRYLLPLCVAVPFLVLGFCLFLASSGAWGDLPDFHELENPETNLATEIMSADNKILGKYFYENRTHVEYSDLSPDLINALIATEDERFFNHSGIDFIALIRVVKGIITNNTSLGGGSTITQQLAKMFFSKKPSSRIDRVKQKFKEWIIAVRIERQYSKEEIIAMYLNRFDFLNLAVGIKSASKIYFNKSPIDLTIQESATLVGMAKNPSLYNPLRRLEKTEKRRNVVLNQMVKNNYLSKDLRDSLIMLPLVLNYKKADHNEGQATYFREQLRAFMTDWSKKREAKTGEKYNIYKDGLKIYTTIDSKMQKYAEISVEEHLKKLQNEFYLHWDGFENAPYDTSWRAGQIDTLILFPAIKRSERYRKLKLSWFDEDKVLEIFNTPVPMSIFSWSGRVDTVLSPLDSIKYYNYFLHSGLISIEPATGAIKAWVGGINHEQFKYDHVKEGKRQVGSTFKPFIYATAIDQFKYSPCFTVPNVQVIFEKEEWGLDEDYIPENANKKYGGEFTLTEGLAKSKNTVSAYLMKRVKPRKVINLARKMGIDSYLPAVPSLCLGTAEISLFEMTGAYSTFANEGMYVAPHFISRIEDKNGIVLDRFASSPIEILSKEKNYIMVKLLEGVVNQGSGGRLRWKYGLTNQIGAKTGTTQNHSDGWFIGFVPNLVTGVWTGADNRSVRFRDLHLGQGAEMALPIWANYMKNLYRDNSLGVSAKNFPFPENGVSVILDCNQKDKINNDEEF
ncbi:MAG: penicillin-binding protein [Flavobacteriales bacterium]|nr:penicillin-binding protein [Flavobacteriales bacterium]|tara:strand:- start:3022 stop:5253 length:2232 start_codon:yes stop_codon:yes gene_type:complete